jgi:endonuclease YncB( thermonuclease family)
MDFFRHSIVKSETKYLEGVKYDDTTPFVPPIKTGKVIKVYDGDTITIAGKMPWPESPIYRFSVRINGIDCPEIRGKCESEKKCAVLARNHVDNLVNGKIVRLENVSLEKYGRILADVYVENVHVGNNLIEKRLAVSYAGGKKQSPDNWLEYFIGE